MYDKDAGQQINLDVGQARILEGYIEDDIFAISSYLHIKFESPVKLLLGADNKYYFTYMGIDWVPMTLDECRGIQDPWQYEVNCCPKCIYTYIQKPYSNTAELARNMGLKLNGVSANLKLPCPIINQYAANIVQDNRFYSLEKGMVEGNIGKGIYIYVNSNEMYSNTWRNMISQTATTFEFPKGTEGQHLVTYEDYQFYNLFAAANGPDVWRQNDYIRRMIGPQFKIETTLAAAPFNVYTIKLEDTPEFDTGLPFLCIYSRKDINEFSGFTHYFAAINYV